MSNVIADVFGFGDEGPTEKERAAKRLQAAKASEVRKRESRESRRRASQAKTLAASQRGGSLFPSDFAPRGSTSLS